MLSARHEHVMAAGPIFPGEADACRAQRTDQPDEPADMESMKMTPINTIRRKAYEMAGSPEPEPIELKTVVLLLRGSAEHESNQEGQAADQEQYEFAAAKAGLERRAELPGSEEENPLDDQDKLDEVRRAVFGSAPE